MTKLYWGDIASDVALTIAMGTIGAMIIITGLFYLGINPEPVISVIAFIISITLFSIFTMKPVSEYKRVIDGTPKESSE